MRLAVRRRLSAALVIALLPVALAQAQPAPAPAPAQPGQAAPAQPAQPAQPSTDVKPFRIGVVTFLSGAAAGPFGVPARNAAEVLAESLNGGKVPAPYAKQGMGGRPIEVVFIDEAGGTTKQVTEYRNLVQRQGVDAVIGYISSGDCLAVAPVAEELQTLTVLFDCGTPRIFEDASYKFVFRTSATAVIDNVAAALYVTETMPKVKKIAGINQNYAWGQDSWNDFEAAMKTLKPDVQITSSQMPKLLAGQYGAEISALMSGAPDVIHSSFWGGDLDAFILQGVPRGVLKKSVAVLTCGETATHKLAGQIPDGTIIGARGPHGVYAPDNALNKWFRTAYQDRFGLFPNYPAYHMSQAILGLKAAYEKAQGAGGGAPERDAIIKAFESLTFESPSGEIKMALGKGHQAIEPTAYGRAKTVGGKLTFVDVRRYPAEKVNPPEGTKSTEWIKSSLKPVK